MKRALYVVGIALAASLLVPALAAAQHNSWVEWTEADTTGQTCGGAFPGDNVTQSKGWHVRFKNTCWDNSTATFIYADPVQQGTGACIGANTGCYPGFQAYHGNGNPLWWNGHASNKEWAGVCREATVDTISLVADGHYPVDPPCPCKGYDVNCNAHSECCSGNCDNYTSSCNWPSPILIDLAGNSANYEMTSPAGGVPFDMNGDGDRETMAWTNRESEVAFLVMDRDGNGVIDRGSELFGTEPKKANGQKAPNGFEALLDLDGGAASDGKADAADPYFTRLRLWIDRNHNGTSEATELLTLAQAGVTTIFTTYHETGRVDENGNAYRFAGRALVVHEQSGQAVPRKVFDVYLQVAPR